LIIILRIVYEIHGNIVDFIKLIDLIFLHLIWLIGRLCICNSIHYDYLVAAAWIHFFIQFIKNNFILSVVVVQILNLHIL